METARRHLLAVGVAVLVALPVLPAAAQMPWPSQAPQQQAPAPWPGQAPPQQQQAAWPGQQAAPPGMPTASPRPMGMGPGPGPGGAGAQQCMAEFAKLRDEVQSKGMAAKAAGQKKASREEMCKLITSYSASEAKWVEFTKTGVTNCGIPPQIATQLKDVHAHTEKTKEQICAAGPAGGGGGAPSISGALGLNTLATDNYKTGNGTLDTMGGLAIRQ
jgi:hypothetical protein